MVNETELEDETAVYEAVNTTERASIGVSKETKEMLVELRSIYMLPNWDSAVRFLIDNMKKVPKPKSKYFD